MQVRFATLAILIGLAMGRIESTQAATLVWTGAEDQDWFNTNNWDSLTAPAGGDDVVIDASSAPNTGVLLSAPTPNLNSLSISNATLTFTNWTTALNATIVTIGTNGVFTLPGPFTNNAMSNRIHVVCSNFMLEAGGSVNADGKGYAEKNGPGSGASNHSGSGGGYGGRGGRSRHYYSGGGPYGTHDLPEAPGSGGGKATSYAGGGHGGGAVRIVASGNVTINGTITANGAKPGHSYSGGGSGGGIYITCAGAFGGTNGLIRANGGSCGGSDHSGGGSGGGGRIAVLYGSLAGAPTVRFSTTPPFENQKSGSPQNWLEMAQKGTLYLSDAAFLSETLSDGLFTDVRLFIAGVTTWTVNSLVVSNCSLDFAESGFRLVVSNDLRIDSGGALGLGSYSAETGVPRLDCGGNLVLTNGGKLHVYSGMTNDASPDYGALVSVTNDIRVASNSWIFAYSHGTNGGAAWFRMHDLTIAPNGGMNAHARGYQVATGPGKGVSGTSGTGAGHGGKGGRSQHSGAGGVSYGSVYAPVQPGSGGGYASGCSIYGAGYGGGCVRIHAAGQVTVDGTINANGANAGHQYNGGGSGGSVHIVCAGAFDGTTGEIQANGGSATGSGQQGGGGGGGRIAIWSTVPEMVAARILAGEIPNGVQLTDVWPTYLGAISVTNGMGYIDPPDPAGAQPGTVVFITYRPSGTVITIR